MSSMDETNMEAQQQTQLSNQEKLAQVASNAYEWVESCIFTIAVVVLIFVLVLRSATVAGKSMEPTLYDGDWLVLQQLGYSSPQYGDIVVIDRTHTGEKPIIKRVIGVAGDVIDIDYVGGQVYRNGERLDEPYINDIIRDRQDVKFPVIVPAGKLFVLGDNRNYSLDSRDGAVGMVDIHRVMGKAIFRFLPITQIGVV